MCERSVFPVIDLPGTGRNIRRLRERAGVTVRELQAYFGFEYPQAIYKWQHGECLPSVDNLLALSRVLRVPMEDLLVYEDREVSFFWKTVRMRVAAQRTRPTHCVPGAMPRISPMTSGCPQRAANGCPAWRPGGAARLTRRTGFPHSPVDRAAG